MRREVGIRNMPKSKSGFYNALERIEKKYKVPRERLKIITEPKINLITRFEEKPFLKAEQSEFKNACALIFIEKSTIIAAIEEDKGLTDRGIYIIKSMGFSTREINKMIKQAQDLGVPILTLTDYDPSGVLIDLKIKEAGVKTARLGVDPKLVRSLGLKIEDVREPLPRAKKKLAHFKYLKRTHPRLAKGFIKIGEKGRPYRIEIDGVFALAGKDRFMTAILKRADEVIPVKPVQRSLVYKKVPKKVEDLRASMHRIVDNLFERIAEEAVAPHKDVKRSFVEIRLSAIERGIEQVIDQKAKGEATVEILEETITKLQKLLEKQQAIQRV